ncbi:MAG: site-specific integrase [Spirochaetaceae bacterium]|jgi:integrase|nr:site-specific integrase [Spirochaetaceae bacterium]
MHNDFTLFTRKVPSGKTVVYYYAYDDEGRRLGPWTTGEANKTAARNYCNKLNREGRLLPGPKEMPTFAEYCTGFWDWENSPYLKERKKRRKLTQSYADKNQRVVEYTLLPYFGKMRVDKITADEIEKWFDHMIKEGYKHTTINGYYGTLKTMLVWAAKKKLIPGDPLAAFERLMNDRKDLKIITVDEFKDLFVTDWRKVWGNDVLRCTANKLAALTGMRMCEVLGLRGEFVFDKNLFLCGQFDGYGYRETKTKIKHHIPLAAELVRDLRKLIKVNGEGFLFSLDGGIKPVTPKHIGNGLRKAFKNIGLTDDEISDRGLNFHAWRHFCNTELQKAGLTVKKVQAVTGHKSERMTEWYTHFDPSEFGEVPKIQAKLLKPKTKKEPSAQTDKSVLTLVERPENKKAS